MGSKFDLNDVQPSGDEYVEGAFRVHHRDEQADVEAFVDQLPMYLCERIKDASFIAGCMAWFTNRRVLDVMARLETGCQIVVQKEDFLRPDDDVTNIELRALYGQLKCPDRFNLPLSDGSGRVSLSYLGDPSCDAVRCMGVRNRGNGPRMHHKFFVFFNRDLVPYAVWTGSFNATSNGQRSRENAVFIRSARLARFYADEWTRALSLSEPLDWESEYVDPQWRFGS
jgi:hypothetical protein